MVLYDLLAQHAPYADKRPEAFVAAVDRRPFTPLRTERVDAPAALTQAVERCLEPEADARPGSAASLQAMLEQALAGRRVDLSGWMRGLLSADQGLGLRRTGDAHGRPGGAPDGGGEAPALVSGRRSRVDGAAVPASSTRPHLP